MSSKDPAISRDDVLAARKAKKQSKQKAKKPGEVPQDVANVLPASQTESTHEKVISNTSNLGKDEVDRAIKTNRQLETRSKESKDELLPKEITSDKSREQIKAERAAKKAAKQTKKNVNAEGEYNEKSKKPTEARNKASKNETLEESRVSENENMDVSKNSNLPIEKDLTVREMVDTLKDIVNVAKQVQAVTDKVKAIDLGGKKHEENVKSKAELRAERRAKQEAQRAAKQAQQKPAVEKLEKDEKEVKTVQKPSPKQKTLEKPKSKAQSMHRINWFQHLYTEHDKEALKKIPLNSHLHPAVIKLGVQLATHVVTGSNARCIALLDALKKMVRDYSLPAKTEFARGLESHLAASLEFLWSMRQPSASQTNAVKHFRRQLTQLPNNVDEFDAKKTLQEEIDRYIREQIDMAGEAISIAVRNKISNGDTILTYGCSSLIERILCEAWESGLRFRVVLVGERVRGAARELLRRLAARGLPAACADVSALSCLMRDVSKVVVGAGGLLVNGSVLCALGAALVALVARAHNVPLLVACETHKFSGRVQTDAFVYNELGDPDDLIDKSDENSPLKDWRSNPNLTLLNLTYDVIPPSLVTAVVTELAILPCTSAPVVLRFKLSEYGM